MPVLPAQSIMKHRFDPFQDGTFPQAFNGGTPHVDHVSDLRYAFRIGATTCRLPVPMRVHAAPASSRLSA